MTAFAWTGGVNTDLGNPGNYSGGTGLPTAADSLDIPQGLTNYPATGTSNAGTVTVEGSVNGGTFSGAVTSQNLVSGYASLNGGTFNGTVTSGKEAYLNGGTYNAPVVISPVIDTGYPTVGGGTYNATVTVNSQGILAGGTYNAPVVLNSASAFTGINSGTFNSTVSLSAATGQYSEIISGTFIAAVTLGPRCYISGGTFSGPVDATAAINTGFTTITGGTFSGQVKISKAGTWSGATFNPVQGTQYFVDWTTQSYWPVVLPNGIQPTYMLRYAHDATQPAQVLLGCLDGYLRNYSAIATDDDGTTMVSFVVYGPFRLGGPGYYGQLAQIAADLDINGQGIGWGIFGGNTAEDAVNAAVAGGTHLNAALALGAPWGGAWAAGFNHRTYPMARGAALAIMLYGNAGWAVEAVRIEARKKGVQQ